MGGPSGRGAYTASHALAKKRGNLLTPPLPQLSTRSRTSSEPAARPGAASRKQSRPTSPNRGDAAAPYGSLGNETQQAMLETARLVERTLSSGRTVEPSVRQQQRTGDPQLHCQQPPPSQGCLFHLSTRCIGTLHGGHGTNVSSPLWPYGIR